MHGLAHAFGNGTRESVGQEPREHRVRLLLRTALCLPTIDLEKNFKIWLQFFCTFYTANVLLTLIINSVIHAELNKLQENEKILTFFHVRFRQRRESPLDAKSRTKRSSSIQG